MGFLDELDTAIHQGEGYQKKKEKQPETTVAQPKKLSMADKIRGVKGAFERLSKSGVMNRKSYATEKEAIERTVCCTTCTDGTSCPYCGCGIKRKRLLATESCPNKQTYSHLSSFPPKDYWSVAKEKTSVIIASRNEKHLAETVNNLLKTSTGNIEILVGVDGLPLDSHFVESAKSDPRIKIHVEDVPIGRRVISNKLVDMATGVYLFEADAHVIMKEVGWDTKMKCVCEPNTIVGCVMDSINEETWEPHGNKWLGWRVDEEFNWDWWVDMKSEESWQKVEETLSFHSAAWMIRKNTFVDIGKHKTFLGEYVNEDVEFTCDILCRGGKILVRTDVECAHLFRDKFPYTVVDNDVVSKRFLANLWDNDSVTSYKTIKGVIKDFTERHTTISS